MGEFIWNLGTLYDKKDMKMYYDFYHLHSVFSYTVHSSQNKTDCKDRCISKTKIICAEPSIDHHTYLLMSLHALMTWYELCGNKGKTCRFVDKYSVNY